MSAARKQSVRVAIVGEEYTIRSDAAPEHTRAVAEHVDAVLRRVQQTAPSADGRRSAILAALEITDELFALRAAGEELTAAMRALSAEARRLLPPEKRAGT